MSRSQVGIDRLPARRMSNEPRESMNCKSCRKRKIKCNRLRPTCEACQVFQCACIYDAVPKKRGPKTDVLEALLKRVDGLERRLKDKKSNSSNGNNTINNDPPTSHDSNTNNTDGPPETDEAVVTEEDAKPKRPVLETTHILDESAVYSPISNSEPSPSSAVQPDVLLDTYFSRCHGKAYYILDESSTRQRLQTQQIPPNLIHAIYAVAARYTSHPNGYDAAVKMSEDYAMRARKTLDIDEPSIDTLQTALLLAVSYTAAGKGKRAYMMLSNAIAMAMALELHREPASKARITPVEREMRKRLFWTCYLMDRFYSCGSKRPSLIADKGIILRLPSWSPTPNGITVEGEFFQNGSNLQYHSGTGKKSQGSSGMLIDIVRILGITNRYLAAGGVKGDSHFPWHSLSNLSKIRQDLDIWASGTQDVFSSVDTLFGQADSTTLVLSKLIYHLIHCLIYRPFLPIDLAELAGSGQHQSWQIEATSMCFLHANAIAELVELGKQSITIEWPAFVGYCICTAGTVHVHGTHYKGGPREVFSASAEFLSREMQQLSELRYTWSSVQHQRETLQMIYGGHSELVKSLASNPMRYSPVFHLEDFFDRYNTLGQFFDGAHISFMDVVVDSPEEPYTGHDLYAPRVTMMGESSSKRKASSSSSQRKIISMQHNGRADPHQLISPNESNPNERLHFELAGPPQPPLLSNAYSSHMPALAPTPFSPPTYNFTNAQLAQQAESFDPMFGMAPMHGGSGYGFGESSNQEAVRTPGQSSNHGSIDEKDPFLSLLEQLAENEHSRGGPSELDFFLSGANG